MLAKEKDLDAVYIMTPDHLHATIALAAMKEGKHVIVHKPMGNVLREARLVAETARQTGLGTHMFCSAGVNSTAQLCEWIWAGAIGPVREVHNWSTRPFWPQGMTSLPTDTPRAPDGLDWDLWLGPVPHRPYNPAYTHAVFRGWYDFGTGALGDMGHYSFFQIFKILKLGAPLTVEASRSQYWKIDDLLWIKQVNTLSYPRASSIHWEFPEREGMPPVSLHWYDGGLRPPIPRELQEDGKEMPAEGLHPHVHALVSRGGWTVSGEWIPVPYVDERAAEELFRHKVLALLRRRGLLSQQRIELLLSWRRSGFSVHNRVLAHPRDGRGFEALVRYMSRSPVSLKRLRFAPASKEVVYTRKGGHDAATETQAMAITSFMSPPIG